MLRASVTNTVLLLLLVLLPALHGWLQLADRTGIAAPPAISQFLLRSAVERRTAVRARLAATLERRRRAEELATDVAHDRLTLQEAAASLGEMYRSAPDFPWQTVRTRFPGASDHECSCRLVIGEVRALAGLEREHFQAVACRLEAELEAALERERRAAQHDGIIKCSCVNPNGPWRQ